MNLLKSAIVIATLLLFASTAMADKPFKSKLDGTLTVGKEGKLTLTVEGSDGWKWNELYPAKLTLKDGGGLKYAKKQYKKADKEVTPVKDNIKAGACTFAAKADKAGEATVTGTFKFGLCNAEACKTWEEDVTLKVAVK